MKLLKNLQRNYFWLIKSLETYALGIYFIVLHSSGVFTPPGNVLEYLDDPPFIFLLGCVATISMVYAFWDVEYLFYKPLMTASLTLVWLVFFTAFAFSDWFIGRFSFQTMYSFLVVFSIVGQIVVKRG